MIDAMHDRFLLEDASGKPLGLLLRSGKNYTFYACEPCLLRLDKKLYNSVIHAGRAVRKELSTVPTRR